MDTLTHLLVGAAFAEAGLRERTPLAVPTLLIAANLPDLDGILHFAGRDAALGFRRGWTHGVVAFALLPLLLCGAMLLYDRWRRTRRPGAPRAGLGPILLLAYLGTASHLFLDWCNTYGVRLLMPLDGRWLYGDTLFIIDVWLWLALGGAVFLCNSGTRRSLASWGALALVTTAAVWLGTAQHSWARLAWLGGLAFLAWLRATRRLSATVPARSRRVRRVLLASCLYVGLLFGATVLARKDVEARLPEQGIEVFEEVFVGPVPVRPLAHAVVVETPEGYRFGSYDWLARPRWRLDSQRLSKPPDEPVVTAALEAPCVRGMRNWVRFPWVEVEETGDGYTVHLMDARYTRRRTAGFGGGSVRLSKDLSRVCIGADERSP